MLHSRSVGSFVLAASTALASAAFGNAADAPTGEAIYKAQCASCHGPNGEGTKKNNKPLVGDRSVPQLAKQIGKTMPEDDPGSLSAEDNEKVAAYIYDAFYSPTARERNKPARVELARLTVGQYRNAVADAVFGPRPVTPWPDQHGLKAEYFKGRNFRREDRVLERTDAQVCFDFGTDSPVPEKIEPHEFSMRWAGSLLAPDTGEYEITVRTDHAARLWLNDQRKPLIDAWVKSGNDTEYKTTVFLLGGRAYPLRLEYSKAKQGVDDSKKGIKPKPVKSSIALEWKLPRRAAEPVPERYLSPAGAPESFVVTTPFPPDDRSYGWERGSNVSREWDQATTAAAIETAAFVDSRINQLANTKDGAPDRAAKIRDYARKFMERALRRPLTPDQQKLFVDQAFDTSPDPETGLKKVVLLALKSPRFLYREVGETAEAFDAAARLAFSLWNGPPDQELLTAAAAGRLATREQVAQQAERMMADPRAHAKLRSFLLTWLRVDHSPELSKDAKRFPGFDPKLVSDLRTSLELSLDEAVWGPKPDFRQLFLSDETYVNGRLAAFYGEELPEGADFEKLRLDGGQRAGILTHPYLLANFAYTGETSPIHRGVFMARGILGLTLRPPTDTPTPFAADLHPTLTTRERVTLQTKATNCYTCHGVINPLGFPMEAFDAVGRHRAEDHGKPIDAVGSYLTRGGKNVTFDGPRKMAEFLADSEEVHDAFVEQMFHHLVQQPVRAYGPTTLADLRTAFEKNGYNIRKLAVDILATTALTPRTAAKAGPPENGEPPTK